MSTVRSTAKALYAVLALCGVWLPGAPATAQTAMDLSLSPTLGNLKLSLLYDSASYPSRPVEGQRTDMAFLQQRVRLLAPIAQNDRFEWAALAGFKVLAFDTEAILPDTRTPFPETLWEIQVGTAARWKLSNDWIVGANAVVGSPSDRPFGSLDVMSFQGDAYVRIPWQTAFAWVFALSYSNSREFAPDLPLPGVMFSYDAGPQFQVLVGVPSTSLRWTTTPDLELNVSYFIVRRVRAQVGYRIWGPLWITAGFEWDNQRFFRYDRTDDDARLSYYEKRATAGVRWDITRNIFLEASGGYAFDRFWFESQSYDDRNQDRINVESGPVILLRLSGRL
jgi:hypothetical protein